MIKEGARDRLKIELKELKRFLSDRSQQVRHLVRAIGERLHHLITLGD